MRRFFIAPEADADLNEILSSEGLHPSNSALRHVQDIGKAMQGIADFPFRGIGESNATRLLGQEVRSVLASS